jgi:hypothetical protein
VRQPSASTVTRENHPNRPGVVRASAQALHGLWGSIPSCARAASQVTARRQRRTNPVRLGRGVWSPGVASTACGSSAPCGSRPHTPRITPGWHPAFYPPQVAVSLATSRGSPPSPGGTACFVHGGLGLLTPWWRRGPARPLPTRSSRWFGRACWSRMPPRGSPPPACHHPSVRDLTDGVPPLQAGKTAVTTPEQQALRHPACEPLDDWPRPLGPLWMSAPPCSLGAFRGAAARQDRPAPQSPGPRNLDPHPTTEPPHTPGFDQRRLRRTHRSAGEALRVAFLAAPSRARGIQAQAPRPCGSPARAPQPQPEVTHSQARPTRTRQAAGRVDHTWRLAQPHATQARRPRTCARGEHGADQQDGGVLPHWFGAQRGQLSPQGHQLGRQCQPRETSRGKSGLQLTLSAGAFSKSKNGQSRA